MNTQIESLEKTDGYVFITLATQKIRAAICVGPHGVRVTTLNASHKAWGGMGRGFKSFDDAKSGYKSNEMKTLIDAARELSI